MVLWLLKSVDEHCETDDGTSDVVVDRAEPKRRRVQLQLLVNLFRRPDECLNDRVKNSVEMQVSYIVKLLVQREWSAGQKKSFEK